MHMTDPRGSKQSPSTGLANRPVEAVQPSPQVPHAPDRRIALGMFVGIAVLSASLLAFQVLLTRVCALRLHFHFSFLIISNSLLGIGASGTVLTLLEARWRKDPAKWIWGASVLYLVSLALTWWFAIAMPVPEKLEFGWSEQERAAFLNFALYNLGLAVPFFFGGGAVGLILSAHSHRIHTVYASDLLGAGLGCLLCPILLWPVGAGGCLMVVAILGFLAMASVAPSRVRRASALAAAVLGIGCAVMIPFFDQLVRVPGKSYLKMTRNSGVNVSGVPHEYSRWSANSRIDVGKSDEALWYMLALGGKDQRAIGELIAQNGGSQASAAKVLRERFGAQKYIMQDGDAGTFITNLSDEHAGARELLHGALYSMSAAIKAGTGPKVFVVGVGGANDVWAHKLAGASRIRGIELNRGVLDVHRSLVPDFSKGILEDKSIELVNDEGRSALMRDPDHYDIIQMTGIDTWTALASGAYVLAENYLYTVEAVMQMYQHLAPGGVIQITRMGENMEKLRLLSNVYEAFRRMGVADFADSVAVVTSPWDQLTAVVVHKGVFPPAECERLATFCAQNEHVLSYLPGRDIAGVVQDFVRSADKARFIADFPRAISPTTDDKPYFFNFYRWDQPAEASKYLNDATSLSQGNPVFLWGQLGFSTIVAVLLIVVPLLFQRSQRQGAHAGRFLVYFTGIGVGFIFIEIAMMQKLTLLLGQPLYSIVVTLFSILVFTGLGSFLSGRWLQGGVARARAGPAGGALLMVAVVLAGTPIVDAFIGSPLAVRAVVAGAMVAPVALLLGMPFAHGVKLLERCNPHFVPWAWAVNGSATVVGSVATVIVSMNFGFDTVLLAAAAIYAIAFLATDRLARAA
jgi:spermidine synthase